jgi:hypothetical protein
MWFVRTPACSANLVPRRLLPLNLDPLYLILGCLWVERQVYRRLERLGVGSKFSFPFGVRNSVWLRGVRSFVGSFRGLHLSVEEYGLWCILLSYGIISVLPEVILHFYLLKLN